MANEWISIVFFIAGLFFIIKGADWITEYGSRIAKKLGISELLIGLTLVAMATSLPELAVSLMSVFSGSGGIATGTIIGSNISNIALILGISALAYPLVSDRKFMNQAFATLGFSVLAAVFLLDGMTWVEGLTIIVFFIGYLIYSIKHSGEVGEKFSRSKRLGKESIPKYMVYIIVSGLFVVLGANLMITSTVTIAGWLGISEVVISIIIIAIGTSLPEMATSVTAARKRMHGLSLGNIIGSNVFNIAILGISSLVATIPVTAHLITIDLPIMIATVALLMLLMWKGRNLSRKEGAILILVYILFLVSQFV